MSRPGSRLKQTQRRVTACPSSVGPLAAVYGMDWIGFHRVAMRDLAHPADRTCSCESATPPSRHATWESEDDGLLLFILGGPLVTLICSRKITCCLAWPTVTACRGVVNPLLCGGHWLLICCLNATTESPALIVDCCVSGIGSKVGNHRSREIQVEVHIHAHSCENGGNCHRWRLKVCRRFEDGRTTR